MKTLLLTYLLMILGITTGSAQYISAKDSDPEALTVLTKAGQAFGSGNALVNFKLKSSFPGQEAVQTEGVLYQQGKNYRMELKDYHIISNGTTRWVYLRGANEVNIYNESNGQDWISPQDFLQLHKSNDLVFTLAAKKSDGTSVIEAKPLKGRFDEYSKFTIGVKNGKLSYINALTSDGARQEMTITSVTNPSSLDANKLFTFHAESHPGVYIEDLRLD